MELHLPIKLGTGVTLSASLSPLANTVAVFPTPASLVTQTPPTSTLPRATRAIHFTQYDTIQLEKRSFLIKTYTLWSSLQSIERQYQDELEQNGRGYRPEALPPPPPPAQIAYYNRLSGFYRAAISEQLSTIESDTTLQPAARLHLSTHYSSLYSILFLAEVLYVPASIGGVVGEELLDWLNTVDRAPSREDGEELSALGSPWESDVFWPYLYRCVLRAHLPIVSSYLEVLATAHSSPTVRQLAEIPRALVDSFPRSITFQTEREFLNKARDWRRSAKDAAVEFAELAGAGAQDDDEEGLKELMELLLGNEEVILERSEDWKEAVAAWGVWVNPGLRRDDLSDVVQRVTRTLPADSTLVVESVLSSLLKGDIVRALQQCNTISLWLVAHLSDLLDKVGVLPSPTSPLPIPDRNTFSLPSAAAPPLEQSLRDYFTVAYSDILLSNPGLWRIVLDYLSSCGDEGRARMRAVVLAVGLEGTSTGAAFENGRAEWEEDESMREGGQEKENAPPAIIEVLRSCDNHGLEEEKRKICKIYSEVLISKKEYGMAVSYCVSAGDSKRIARIATRVLEEYVVHGQEAFIAHVDSIPSFLLRPPPARSSSSMSDDEDEDEDASTRPYSSQLSFLARYREFFAFYARGERREAARLLVLLLSSRAAPMGFYAVMFLDVVPLLDSPQIIITLAETYDLLRILEELTAPIVASGKDLYGHLDALSRIVGGPIVKGDEKETSERTQKAMKQLDVVRASLARHLGRCCCL